MADVLDRSAIRMANRPVLGLPFLSAKDKMTSKPGLSRSSSRIINEKETLTSIGLLTLAFE